MTPEEANRLAREKGVSEPLYAAIRGVLTPLMHGWFRMRIEGREHVPDEGAAIIAPNHKSFYDSFFVALAVRRPLRYMGKVELFEGRKARLLVRLGAFPVRRGESDADALATARAILAGGELLAIFPEGTRVREPETLGTPRRGAGRLALEAGAPLVPAAITGTDNLWAGPFPKPKRVQVKFSPPIPVAEMTSSPEEAGKLVEDVLWPEVETQFKRLRARPSLIAAAIAALGVGGGIAVARRRNRGRNTLAGGAAKALRRRRSLPERASRSLGLGRRRRLRPRR